jgi:hypothetical protein
LNEAIPIVDGSGGAEPETSPSRKTAAPKRHKKKHRDNKCDDGQEAEIKLAPSIYSRLVLRSDVVVRRLLLRPLGFSITIEESDDYHLALQ